MTTQVAHSSKPPFRASCADYTWPGLSHSTVLTVISDIGFDGVDLGLFGDATHLKLTEALAGPEQYAEAVRARLDHAGLEVADVFLTPDPTNLSALDPANTDENQQNVSLRIFESAVKFAAELGASGMTLLPGVRHPGQTYHDALRVASQQLGLRVEQANARGLRLSIEPHLGSIVDTAERVTELVHLTPGLEITLDPAHLVFGGCTLNDMLELRPEVRHLQLRAGGLGKMQSRLSDNEIDFERLLAGFWESGYSGWLAIEYVWMTKWGCNSVDNTTETILLKRLVEDMWVNL